MPLLLRVVSDAQHLPIFVPWGFANHNQQTGDWLSVEFRDIKSLRFLLVLSFCVERDLVGSFKQNKVTLSNIRTRPLVK